MAATAGLNRRLAESWPEIRRRLLAVMLPVAEMECAIEAAGMPHRGRDLGLDPAFYLAAPAGMLEAFAAGEE
jgi:hypothetical protein